jgi:hypothetical protein
LYGLDHAHRLGVLHRDVKPQNLLFGDGRLLKVADFGIASVVGTEMSVVTGTGQRLGTPAFMAPEQLVPELGEVSAASDVWAVGAILYEMLAGQRPFGPGAGPALLRRTVEDAVALRQIASDTPAALSEVVERSLARLPGERFHTAADFAEALEQATYASFGRSSLAETNIPLHRTPTGPPAIGVHTARPTSPTQWPARWRSWRLGAYAGLAVTLIAAAAISAIVLLGAAGSAPASHRRPAGSESAGRGPAVPVRSTYVGRGAAGLVTVSVITNPDDIMNSPVNFAYPDYLIPLPADKIGPPPSGTDGTTGRWAWAHKLGGVDADESVVRLTVQGTTSKAVVLQTLRVKVLRRRKPSRETLVTYDVLPPGASLPVRQFGVNLDKNPPLVSIWPRTPWWRTPMVTSWPPRLRHRVMMNLAGISPHLPLRKQNQLLRRAKASRWGPPMFRHQRMSFPLSVSASDPEVIDLGAYTSRCDCTWAVEISWTSGSHHGVLRSTDYAPPFRTMSTTDATGKLEKGVFWSQAHHRWVSSSSS